MIYWDTSYLAKLYIAEPGAEQVLNLMARHSSVMCSEHGRLELMTAFKRNQREGIITSAQLNLLWQKHAQDVESGFIRYLPASSVLIDRACTQVASLPPKVFLRAADALHLACAAEAGCRKIYSHDRHLLAAARHFGIKGMDIILG